MAELTAGMRTDLATCQCRLRYGTSAVKLPKSIQVRYRGEKLQNTAAVRTRQPLRLRGLHQTHPLALRCHRKRQPVVVQAAITTADGGMKELWEVAPKWKEYPVGKTLYMQLSQKLVPNDHRLQEPVSDLI